MYTSQGASTAQPHTKHFRIVELDKVHYPVQPNHVPALEHTLKTNISVFSFDNNEVKAHFPLYVSDTDSDRSVELLYWLGTLLSSGTSSAFSLISPQ